jgi:hypothetical protein
MAKTSKLQKEVGEPLVEAARSIGSTLGAMVATVKKARKLAGGKKARKVKAKARRVVSRAKAAVGRPASRTKRRKSSK